MSKRNMVPFVAIATVMSFGLMAMPTGTSDPEKTEPDSKAISVTPVAIDLANPSLIEALGKIQGFNAEQFGQTISGKTSADFAVTPNSAFFQPLDEQSLAARRAENAKYAPFSGDMLPRADGEYMIGAYQVRTDLKFENGKTKIEYENLNAVLPGQNLIFIEYTDKPDVGEAWKIPDKAYVSQQIIAVPVMRGGKPNGRYFVMMPLRDANYDDIAKSAASYGDYVVEYAVRTARSDEKPKFKKIPGQEQSLTQLNARGIEFYGDALYMDPEVFGKTLDEFSPVGISRPLILRGVQKTTINGQPYAIALGTESTDGKNPYVMTLRAAVGAKEWIFHKEKNLVPKSCDTVAVGVVKGGDATKLDGHVFMRNSKQERASR